MTNVTGNQASNYGETTPLRRDNSLIRPDRMPSTTPPESAYGSQPRTNPPTMSQPGMSQPGMSQPGMSQPGMTPAYPATARQAMPMRQEPPRTPSPQRQQQGVTAAGWLLRGLVLAVIAVLSGVVWLLVKPDSAPEEPPPVAQPKYDFGNPLLKESSAQGCREVSTDQIKNFFVQQECEHLTRALYSTTLADGSKVITSVVTVLMPTEASAQQLNELTTKDGTGNIRDLADDDRAGTEGMPGLDDRAYASERQGQLVVIGDSAYQGKSIPKNDPQLRNVTTEALKLGWPQNKAP